MCVCVCEREREREGEKGQGLVKLDSRDDGDGRSNSALRRWLVCKGKAEADSTGKRNAMASCSAPSGDCCTAC